MANIATAFANTLMGMGTVFVMLIFISLLISLFGYIPKLEEKIKNIGSSGGSSGSGAGGGNDRDEYFEEAARFIIDKDKASIGMLQRVLKIGFNRAARIMDQLCEYGVVGEEEGTKPRKVLMSMEQFENYLEQGQ